MRFNALENFFGREPESQLPNEIFHDDQALKEYFLEYVGKKGWAEEQIRSSDKQADNARKENNIDENSVKRLVGTEWLTMINPVKPSSKEPPRSVADLSSATYALHFTQLSQERVPRYPGDYLWLEDEDRALPAGETTNLILSLENRLNSNPHWALELELPSRNDIALWTSEAEDFLDALGLTPLYERYSDDRFVEHWQFAVENIVKFIDSLEKFHYASFVIDIAINDIIVAVPAWAKLRQQIKDHLVIHISQGSRGAECFIPGDFHHIILELPSQISADVFTDNFLSTVHEFVHAFVHEMFFGNRHIRQNEAIDPPHLMGALQEGAAITIEQAIIQLHNLKADPNRLPEWATSRLLKTIAVLQNRHAKDLSELEGAPHYTEGIRIARSLAKKGLRVENIPDVMKKMAKIALRTQKTDDNTELYRIPITYARDSAYQHIIQDIT